MKKTSKKILNADDLADLVDAGHEVSQYFTGVRMVHPPQRVNVDFAPKMLTELDQAASELNISRQALIKTLVLQALDQHYLAVGAQRSSKAA